MRKSALGAIALTATLILVTAVLAMPSDPKRLVLQLRDVPSGFDLDEAKYVSAAAVANANDLTVARYKAWGYVDGYEVHFKRKGAAVRGAAEIVSQLSVYRTMPGAQASLTDSAKRCTAEAHGLRKLRLGRRIAHAAHLCTITNVKKGFPYQIFMVLWRRGRLRAAVLVLGPKGSVVPSQAVKLALRQDARMRYAGRR
jgi:hypothetical protein